MRLFAIAAAFAGLAACDVNDTESEASQASERSAALTYDGADYGSDRAAMVGGRLFSHMTDAERAAVVNYVKARADTNMAP